jgi:hypothetical protein
MARSVKTFSKDRVIGALTATVICGLAASPAAASDWFFSGYIKSYGLAQTAPDIDGLAPELDEPLFQSQNALRLMLAGQVTDRVAVEIHYEAKPIFSSADALASIGGSYGLTTTGQSRFRYDDLDSATQIEGPENILLQNLDRLNVQLSTGDGQITLGRQAIAFGSARMVSPTDIFEPFVVSTLDREYRLGVDAVRYEHTFGGFSELDLGVVFGDQGKRENSAAFVRFKTALEGNDLEATILFQDGLTLFGGGIERALGNFGFWLEAAYVSSTAGPDYGRLSTGLDMAITDTIFFMAEVHHNSAGSTDPSDYVSNAASEPFSRGGVYLLGKNYFIPAVTWTVTPLLGVQASGYYNIDDHSIFLSASGEYSLSEDLYMDFGVYLSGGKSGTVELAPPFLTLGSEFGSFPSTIYASLRYYF